jgi:ornithine carbamoyltransferase
MDLSASQPGLATRLGAGMLPPADSAVVLAYARMLQREARAGACQPWLRGKNIGMLGEPDSDPAAELFRRAAHELGAKVAQVRPFVPGLHAPADLLHTAHLLGRLYDAIEWPGASAGVLNEVQAAAGIPVYDGLGAPSHPTARLVPLLGGDASRADQRRFVLQAVLLATII